MIPTDLKSMSVSALDSLVAEYDSTTKQLSEMLITELALRDELEYDKVRQARCKWTGMGFPFYIDV